MAVFGLLALLLRRALAATSQPSRPAVTSVAITILYAITDELHQGTVAGRLASPIDVGFDSAGAVIAIVAAGLVQERWRRRSAE